MATDKNLKLRGSIKDYTCFEFSESEKFIYHSQVYISPILDEVIKNKCDSKTIEYVLFEALKRLDITLSVSEALKVLGQMEKEEKRCELFKRDVVK